MSSAIRSTEPRRHSPCAIGAERRLTPRVAARQPVRLECSGLPGPLPATLRDIGAGGVCVETAGPFALDSLTWIEIELPAGVVRARGVGLWQRDGVANTGVLSGIRFEDAGTEPRSEVVAFVQQEALVLARFLSRCAHFEGLPMDDALDVAFHTRMVDFRAGSVVYSQGTSGTRGDSLFIVSRGAVVLEARRNGAQVIPIQRIEAGGVFAGIPFLTGQSHIESAIADRDTTLLEIDPYSFMYMLSAKPGVAHVVLRGLLSVRATQLESMITRVARQ